MNDARLGVCALLGVGILVMLYAATSNTKGKAIVPQVQGQAQFLGMNVNGALESNGPTPLDMSLATHFWAPGFNPRDGMDTSHCVKTPIRYPIVPGGNVSSVAHKGWGGFLESCPNNEWFFNPPEAAVL